MIDNVEIWGIHGTVELVLGHIGTVSQGRGALGFAKDLLQNWKSKILVSI